MVLKWAEQLARLTEYRLGYSMARSSVGQWVDKKVENWAVLMVALMAAWTVVWLVGTTVVSWVAQSADQSVGLTALHSAETRGHQLIATWEC